MKARQFYENRAKELIKELREKREMSYADLALKLKAYGISVSERVLINRINRGTYSFAFALAVLDALNAEVLELPKPKDLYPKSSRPGAALTDLDLRRRSISMKSGG